MPQMLSDLVLRSVNDIAPNAFEPVIEEGVRDGSRSVMFPKQAAEAVSLIANSWINPLVFPDDNEELKAKFEFICGRTKSIGLDISDIYPPVSYTHLDVYKRQVQRIVLFTFACMKKKRNKKAKV